MSPVVALDLRDRRNVAGAERSSLAGEDHEQQTENQKRAAPAYSEACHGADGERVPESVSSE